MLFAVLSLFSTSAGPAFAASEQPLRLMVETQSLEVPIGQNVEVKIALGNARGELARAPRRLAVSVSFRGAGLSLSRALAFREGEATRKLAITPTQPGLVEIQAESPELRQGGAFVQAIARNSSAERSPSTRGPTSPSHRTSRPKVRSAPAVDEHAVVRDKFAAPLPPLASIAAPQDDASGRANSQRESGGGAQDASDDARGSESDAHQTTDTGAVVHLQLRASPDHGLLANGSDPSTLYAFLSRRAGPGGVRVNLVPDTGALSPIPLSIDKGRRAGTAQLTSSNTGNVRVEFVSAEPETLLDGERLLEVNFEPALTALEITAPNSLQLGEQATIAVHLVGEGGNTLATDRPRNVSFVVDSGHGTLSRSRVDIPAGEFEAESSYRADWWRTGTTTLSVASDGFLTRNHSIVVGYPWLLMLVICVASLSGGFLAWAHGKADRRHLPQRLFSGLIGGLVSYSLLRFAAPQGWVNNPFGAFLIAAVGGWLGTKVLDIAARSLLGRRKDT